MMWLLRSLCALIDHAGPGKDIAMDGDFAVMTCHRCRTVNITAIDGVEHDQWEYEEVLGRWML
jgi:hypothetical protein